MFVLPSSSITLNSLATSSGQLHKAHYLNVASLLFLAHVNRFHKASFSANNAKSILFKLVILSFHDKDQAVQLCESLLSDFSFIAANKKCRDLGIVFFAHKDEKQLLEQISHPTKGILDNYDEVYSSTSYADSDNVSPLFRHITNLMELQARFLNVFAAEMSEDIYLQSVAGGGKTFLISEIIKALDSPSIILLAHTKAQLSTFKDTIARSVHTASFFDTVVAALTGRSDHMISRLKERLSFKPISPKMLVNLLDIKEEHNTPPSRIALFVLTTIKNFCWSSNETVSPDHLPSSFRFDPHGKLASSVIALATYYFDFLFDEKQNLTNSQPLTSYHLYKFCHLNSVSIIPRTYSHIIIDEMHSLPSVLKLLVKNTAQAKITFGDPFQSKTNIKTAFEPTLSRHQEINSSYRQGRAVESHIDDIISLHPIDNHLAFTGRSDQHTEVISYTPGKDYQELMGTRFITGSPWYFLAFLTDLIEGGAKVHIEHSCKWALTIFLSQAIELRDANYNVRLSHPKLQYQTWSGYKGKLSGAEQDIVSRYFSKKFRKNQLESLLHKTTDASQSHFTITFLDNARNLEYRSVAMMPDLYDLGGKHSNSFKRARAINDLYTATTRVKHKLFLPLDYDSILDQSV